MTDKTDSKEREAMVREICRAVAELPDRNSPEDWPEAMLVTHEELADILRASLAASAGSEPVAFLVCTEEGDPDMVFLSQHDAQQYLEDHERPTPLYTHPSPPEGMGGGWTKASQQLPPCGDGQLFIGVNSAGFACVFNEITSNIVGAVHCLYETAEECIDVMSGLDLWRPFSPPTTSAGSGKG
ncbi:hypothetical protein [Acidovorax kalamii]|uniref:hypothetical protein n=1 Tax=Acidovorax kalamii TaxID=2004485 RepID=UPI002091AD5A|nr:hypothetical protein [Acidovorax kalamii]MCO5355117.1 hypothetical protein [Acidovorax kalamii]